MTEGLIVFIALLVGFSSIGFPIWLVVMAAKKRQQRTASGTPLKPPEHRPKENQQAAQSDQAKEQQTARPPTLEAEPSDVPRQQGPVIEAFWKDLMGDRVSGARLLLVAMVALLMLAPLSVITEEIKDRAEYQRQVSETVQEQWGGPQKITGPVLLLPYEHAVSIGRGAWHGNRDLAGQGEGAAQSTPDAAAERPALGYLVLLPETIMAKVNLLPEKRQIGPYDHVVYTAQGTLSGQFKFDRLGDYLKANPQLIPRYDQAKLILFSAGARAFSAVNPAKVNGQDLEFGVVHQLLGEAATLYGVQSLFPVDEAALRRGVSFDLSISLRGSGDFLLAPVGKASALEITSSWGAPGFRGTFLPDQHTLTPDGFQAGWTMNDLARATPQVSELGLFLVDWYGAMVGVELVHELDFFGQMIRSTKYGILFIFMAYAVLLGFELCVVKRQLHLVQYALVGVTLTVFYLTLLSMAFWVGFGMAYAIAAVLASVMVGGYVGAGLRSLKAGSGIGGVLSVLYGGLYLLLNQGDYALQAGTALVLVTVTILMILTRNLAHQPPPTGKKDMTNP